MSKSSPKISVSDQRGSFQQRWRDKTDIVELAKLFDNMRHTEESEEWKKNNLEYDLRTTDWILEKVRSSDVYAQNLYAALCNNRYLKYLLPNTEDNLVDVLKSGLPKWSCSWRHAGGVIADMKQTGDYIDWYCSGIKETLTPEEIAELTPEQRHFYDLSKKNVGEGHITDEVLEDLRRLGWIPDPDY